MKIRNGFVSNSSSSSFIIIGSGNYEIPIGYDGEDFVIDHKLGKHQYGWEDEVSRSFGSKVCFAYIQALYLDYGMCIDILNTKHLDMLDKVLYENLNCSNIILKLSISSDDNNWSYIDHQSAATDGENIEMFNSEDLLFDFLFSRDSYIQTGNDNE